MSKVVLKELSYYVHCFMVLKGGAFGVNSMKFWKYTFLGVLVFVHFSVGSLSASVGMCGNSCNFALIFAILLILGHE